ncbi:MAG: DCC1-like thiol-disulfide oxidoreductase family protein [Parasphingorhabdus sp.]
MAARLFDLTEYPESDQIPEKLPLVVFDSDCILCSRSMRILAWMDRRDIFRLTPAQGKLGEAIYRALDMPIDNYETFLLVERSLVWGKSDAILRMVYRLGWPWRALGLLRIIPRSVRDSVYTLIARHRYRIFGRRQACGLNQPALSDKII